MASAITELERPEVVPQAEWFAAHKDFMAKEKEFTRLRDELSRQRRQLPWEKVEKEYIFDGPNGKQSLAELFGGRSQLVVYHFMLAPKWSEGCRGCSYLADHFDGPAIHLLHRDVTLAAISRAPISEIQAFKKRMGWKFPWVSSFNSHFNYDYHVSFTAEERAKGKVRYNYDLAVPTMLAGLAMSRPVAGASDSDLQFGFPMIFQLGHAFLHPGGPALAHYYLHPVALAGWAECWQPRSDRFPADSSMAAIWSLPSPPGCTALSPDIMGQ